MDCNISFLVQFRQYVGKADFLVFRTLNQHGFLGQLQEKKLVSHLIHGAYFSLVFIGFTVYRFLHCIFFLDTFHELIRIFVVISIMKF